MMSWAGFDGIVRDGGPDCWSKRVCWTTPRAGGHLDRSGDEAGVVSGAKQDGAPMPTSSGEGDLGYTLLRAMRARAGSVLRHRQPRDAAARVSVRPRASETFRAENASCSGLHVYPAPLHAVSLVQYLRATSGALVVIGSDLFGILNAEGGACR